MLPEVTYQLQKFSYDYRQWTFQKHCTSERDFSLCFEDKRLYPNTTMLVWPRCRINNSATAAGNTDYIFKRLKIAAIAAYISTTLFRDSLS